MLCVPPLFSDPPPGLISAHYCMPAASICSRIGMTIKGCKYSHAIPAVLTLTHPGHAGKFNRHWKGLLHYVTFGDESFAICLTTPWEYYTAGWKKSSPLYTCYISLHQVSAMSVHYFWRFEHFFCAPFPIFEGHILWLANVKRRGSWVLLLFYLLWHPYALNSQ